MALSMFLGQDVNGRCSLRIMVLAQLVIGNFNSSGFKKYLQKDMYKVIGKL